MKIPVQDKTGKKIQEVELKPEIFDAKVNEAVVHEVVRAQRAAGRSGTAKTKTRSEVRGGGKKPWRQKGTGRARAGSIRSPLWTGGGVIFGPTPRDYSIRITKKTRRLALRSILTMKVKRDELVIIDDFGIKEPKTKQALEVLQSLGAADKATIVLENGQEAVAKAVRNIAGVQAINVAELNAYDLLNNSKLVVTKDALGRIEEGLAG